VRLDHVNPVEVETIMRFRTIRLAGFFLGVVALGGCYTYSVAPLESLAPGLQARVRLDEDGFGQILNQAAMSGVPMEMIDLERRGVIGRVVELQADNLRVELRGIGGTVFAAAVPTFQIQEVALRKFSKPRTLAALAAGAIAFGAILKGTAGGTTSPGEPPGPDNMVFPLLSLPLR